MAPKTLEDLFHEILKDIYYAETKSLRTLPKMAKGADCPKLTRFLEGHSAQGQEQLQRLERVFALLGRKPQGRTWPVFDGIIDEGLDLLQHYKSSPALDAGLLAVAQAAAHYEISRYATLKRWAKALGLKEAAGLLDKTLREEMQANEALSALADHMLYAMAVDTIEAAVVEPAVRLPQAA